MTAIIPLQSYASTIARQHELSPLSAAPPSVAIDIRSPHLGAVSLHATTQTQLTEYAAAPPAYIRESDSAGCETALPRFAHWSCRAFLSGT